MDFSKHRTISIISYVVKIVLKVFGERVKAKVAECVDEEQYGFRKGKSIRNAMFKLRTILEWCMEKQKDIHICFVNFEKSFDAVKYNCLIGTLKKSGVDGSDIRVMVKLYWQHKAVVRVGEGVNDWINNEKGVRKGCLFFLGLFKLYTQLVI